MKDDPVALTRPSCTWSLWEGVGARKERHLFCMVLWLSEKISVFRKVTLLELLLWIQTVRGIQRLYILFIVCVCAYSPVWCLLEPEESVDALWSNYGESWNGKLTLTATTVGLWRPVGWLLGVCHSLVHWTLPLHRVILFSWFFFLSLDFSNSASIMTISRANISQLL